MFDNGHYNKLMELCKTREGKLRHAKISALMDISLQTRQTDIEALAEDRKVLEMVQKYLFMRDRYSNKSMGYVAHIRAVTINRFESNRFK